MGHTCNGEIVGLASVTFHRDVFLQASPPFRNRHRALRAQSQYGNGLADPLVSLFGKGLMKAPEPHAACMGLNGIDKLLRQGPGIPTKQVTWRGDPAARDLLAACRSSARTGDLEQSSNRPGGSAHLSRLVLSPSDISHVHVFSAREQRRRRRQPGLLAKPSGL